MATHLGPPKRWLRCPRKGDVIDDKFIPFKTPLDDRYDDQMDPKYWFYPNMVIDSVKGLNYKIGLWIDLTNTDRFYNKSLVENKDVKYVKLACRGHGECPDKATTDTFVSICRKFLVDREPNEIIAVHCTHGFNRTGFLISTFLVEEQFWDISAAVVRFATARPPGIYKEDYLKQLFRNYEDESSTPPTPLLPDWCFEEEEEEDDGTNGFDPGDVDLKDPRRRKEFQKVNPTFMEGVGGVTPITMPTRVAYLQEMCQKMAGWEKPGFPGCQPVSMTQQNIEFLRAKNYKVSWKADGTRYLMMILDEKNIYFVDRDNAVFQAEGVRFPKRKNLAECTKNALLDGEMVVDNVNGTKFARYLIYDIVKFEGENVGGCNFDTRIHCIVNEIIRPREEAKALPESDHRRINRNSEPFSVRFKDFMELQYTHTLFAEKFVKNLGHEVDGLIFQPVPDPYKPGRCDEALKWKPPSHNSVDFKLMLTREDRPGMLPETIGLLYVGGQTQAFARMKVSKALKQFDKKIIECTWDFATQQWKFMRERTDKSFPNAFDTAMAVWDSIRHPITKENLLEFIEHHRFGRVKRQDMSSMPPPLAKRPKV